jgi:hypothetical protein
MSSAHVICGRFRRSPSGETEWIPDGLFEKLVADVSKLYGD